MILRALQTVAALNYHSTDTAVLQSVVAEVDQWFQELMARCNQQLMAARSMLFQRLLGTGSLR